MVDVLRRTCKQVVAHPRHQASVVLVVISEELHEGGDVLRLDVLTERDELTALLTSRSFALTAIRHTEKTDLCGALSTLRRELLKTLLSVFLSTYERSKTTGTSYTLPMSKLIFERCKPRTRTELGLLHTVKIVRLINTPTRNQERVSTPLSIPLKQGRGCGPVDIQINSASTRMLCTVLSSQASHNPPLWSGSTSVV